MNLLTQSVFAVAIMAASVSQAGESVDLAKGQTLYAENCASCHGENLEGQKDWQIPKEDETFPAPPHDRTGHTWHHGDALLFDNTKLGGAGLMAQRGVAGFKSGMPAFADSMSDADIRDVLAYIKSTWPEDVRKIQAERTASEGG